jgi:hypothetical protein
MPYSRRTESFRRRFRPDPRQGGDVRQGEVDTVDRVQSLNSGFRGSLAKGALHTFQWSGVAEMRGFDGFKERAAALSQIGRV